MKKANRRLYALRQLKKCKVPSADIFSYFSYLLRANSIFLEYVFAAFADLPKYLACHIDNVQKRLFPFGQVFRTTYETALEKAALSTLSDPSDSLVY